MAVSAVRASGEQEPRRPRRVAKKQPPAKKGDREMGTTLIVSDFARRYDGVVVQ